MESVGYEWDGEARFATLDGERLPGVPYRHSTGWGVDVLFENGAVLYLNGYEADAPTSIGDAVLRVVLPNPDGSPSDRTEAGLYTNTAAAFLFTGDGVIVEEGVPSEVAAVMYHRDCPGADHCRMGFFGGCDHEGNAWYDTVPTFATLRRLIAAIEGAPVTPSIWPTERSLVLLPVPIRVDDWVDTTLN